MVFEARYKSKYVIVDTSAFIRNANLQDIGETIITVPEVVNEIKSKRQLRRLVVLPYDLQIKEAFPENIKHVTEFSKKTGDYPSLSATDLKVIALTYQLEKEHIGTDHLKTVPEINRSVDYCNYSAITLDKVAGFYRPKKSRNSNYSESSAISEEGDEVKNEKELSCSLENCNISDSESEYLSACSDSNDLDEFVEIDEKIYESDGDDMHTTEENKTDNAVQLEGHESFSSGDNDTNDLINDMFVKIQTNKEIPNEHGKGDCDDDNNNLDYDDGGGGGDEEEEEDDDDDDDAGWITPSNVKQAKQELDADNLEEKSVTVACLTMDFAMQNVLKQIGLNVLSLDGRVIKQMRTFILRCYACFKTTSIMTKVFCHHCGNKTLKRVAVSLDADGNEKIHINLKKPLTARGKKFSLPKPRGGKHPNYPILFEDQPLPDQRPSRLARTKNNPLDPDYIAGFSPFVMRDINSKSAMLGVQNKSKEFKYWMRRNPNESFGKKKKKK